MHSNRIRSFLKLHGVGDVSPLRKDLVRYLESVRLWDGSALPPFVKERANKEHERLCLVQRQIMDLVKRRREIVESEESSDCGKRVLQMMSLKAVGIESAWRLEKEFFGWRKFRNGREIASLSGLCPTPYDSGESRVEQGISKAGNRRVRAMSIELGWIWIRYQPKSKLTRWFNERFASGGKRLRRIGIVAVARKLLIDLWRFVEHGVVPEGAILKGV
jgi:transposase